ncbi:hypothetical protein [Oryzibacter oryziterrae]|uniref:hypothetical protein n=1 Tax=Oryzibacter oryziterrae TaxID=2766474 RepID=UPI001F333D96|nr:hypothetical protein [Oryzibacter oryziterrae]
MYFRSFIAASVAVAAAVAALPLSISHADAVTTGNVTRLAQQGFTADFGSKHAVGYFMKKEGACSVRVVLSQKEGEDFVVGTGATVDVSVAAGDSLRLGSGEGAGLALSCSQSADSLSITPLTSGA